MEKEKVHFKGTFWEAVDTLFVGKKIRCNKMDWYDDEFHDAPDSEAEPKRVPDKIILVRNTKPDDYSFTINDYEYCFDSDDDDCIIEIIED